jgi:hypothetical protein
MNSPNRSTSPFRAANHCACWGPLWPEQCSARLEPPGPPGPTPARPSVAVPINRSRISASRPARPVAATRAGWLAPVENMSAVRRRFAAECAAICGPTRTAAPVATIAGPLENPAAATAASIWQATSITADAAALGALTLVNTKTARASMAGAFTGASKALSTATGHARP